MACTAPTRRVRRSEIVDQSASPAPAVTGTAMSPRPTRRWALLRAALPPSRSSNPAPIQQPCPAAVVHQRPPAAYHVDECVEARFFPRLVDRRSDPCGRLDGHVFL